MSTVSRALRTHPAAPEFVREERAAGARCIEACLETAQVPARLGVQEPGDGRAGRSAVGSSSGSTTSRLPCP